MQYIAFDAHKHYTLAAIAQADGRPVREERVEHEAEDALAEALGGEDAKDRARLVLAATWGLGLYEFVMTGTLDAAARALFLQRLLNATTERS